MKRYAKYLLTHPLFSGSFIMIVGSNVGNIFAYLYHLIFGRVFGPSLYGELAATLSLLGILSASFTFLGMVIVKFIASHDEKELEQLFSWFTKRAFIFGFTISLIIILFSSSLSDFLHINSQIMLLVGPTTFFFLISFVYRSYLQGLLRFGKLVVSSTFELLARLLLGLLFVYLGWSVFGAAVGIFIGSILGFLSSSFFLRDKKLFSKKENFKGGKNVFIFALPVFLTSLSSSSFITTDLILVKHFFTSHDTGIYASLSTLGKIIFYGTAPIASVMFPLVTRGHAKGKKVNKVFKLSFLMTGLIGGGVLLIYALFPRIVVGTLFGSRFFEAIPYLISYSLFMILFSLISITLAFFLSIGKTKVAWFSLIVAILQIIGISLFHDSIFNVIFVSLILSLVLLLSLIVYFNHEKGKFGSGR